VRARGSNPVVQLQQEVRLATPPEALLSGSCRPFRVTTGSNRSHSIVGSRAPPVSARIEAAQHSRSRRDARSQGCPSTLVASRVGAQ